MVLKPKNEIIKNRYKNKAIFSQNEDPLGENLSNRALFGGLVPYLLYRFVPLNGPHHGD